MAQAGLTKITAPVLQDVIERELCFKAIDSSLQKRIVWMSAPAGSGKTTLAASYLKSRSNPFLWYHMDGTDIDVSTFFSYMTLAVKTLLHQKNAELPEFTSEYFKNVPAFAARYFKKLFTLVAEAVKEEDIYRSTETHAPFLIVFDNYQNTLADSAIHDVLGIGFSLMPEGFASIVISRLEPPIEYADLRRNGDLGFFEWNDLLFTMDDTLNLVRAFTKIEVPEEIIRQLHKKMEGWVAGLILAIERGNIASLMSFLEKTEVNEVVFDYFAREILEKTESNVRDFLFKTAYLQEFSIPMAERLTGYVHSRKILSEKHRQYFITKKHTHSGVMFVYHDLFHAFLRAHAKEYFRQNEDEIVRRAEDILEEDGYFEAAVQLCIDMSDWEKLTTIVLKHVASMIAHGRGAILNRWFAAIPDDFIEKQPWLLYWKGMNMLQTNPAETRKILEISYEKFKSTDDLKGLLSAFCSIVDTFVYEWKDFHPLDYWINEYEELTNRHKDTPLSLSFSIQDIPLELRQRLSSSIFSALMFRQPWHQDMPYWEEEVLKILRHSQNIIQLMSLGHNLILYYLYTGKIYKAGVIIETLFPVIEKSKGNLLARLMFCRSQSLYFFYSASYRQGLKVVEEGLELAREYDVHMLDLMLFGTATYISLAIGDNEAAEKYLKKMESSMVNVQCFGNIYYHQIVSLVALSRGQYKSAIDHAEINIQLTVDLGSYLILGIFEYSIAYIYTESGQYEEARHHIKESLNFGVITGSTLPTYICTMLEALISFYENNEKQFVEKIKSDVTLSREIGMRFTFFLQSSTERLCIAAIEKGIETDFIKEMIRLHNITPGSYKDENWPYPLKVYTLGRFAITVDEKLVNFSGKTQRKPLEMLKAIIAYGGKDVGITQLSDTLWPDVDGDLATKSFHTTLHRLRKLLRFDSDAIIMSDNHVSINSDYCWIDVWSLRDIIDELESTVALSDVEQKIDNLYKKALNIYKGDFLPGEHDQSWAAYQRERLKDEFIRICNKAGSFYESVNKCGKAIECYKTSLDTDYLREECFSHLITCYLKAGLKGEALATYNKCKHIFNTVLAISPSVKTENLYKSIMENN